MMVWTTHYASKVVGAEQAMSAIQSGFRIFMTGNCSVPQVLLRALIEHTHEFQGLELVQVLAIGGLKEKLLAAHRGGIRTVIIPSENEKDLKEIPENIKSSLKIMPVKWIDQVLELALSYAPVVVDDGAVKPNATGVEDEKEAGDRINTH